MVAPVIIPTLNRKNHLKRCLESLSNNTLASQTEVYISVDYPPSKKYEKGYLEVKEYLQNLNDNNFKSIHLFFQEKNLGPFANIEFLRKEVYKNYDTCILTEDDNEFSKNYLEYINILLEKYKNDPQVIAVCGAKDTNWYHKDDENIVFSKLFSAYGVAQYLKKDVEFKTEATKYLLDKNNWRVKSLKPLYKKNRLLFNLFILDVILKKDGIFWKNSDDLNYCDSLYSIYMHLSNYCVIAPTTAKARTWGNDGSGVNMPLQNINVEKEHPLDSGNSFILSASTNPNFYPENYKIGNDYMNTVNSWKMNIKAIVCYFILVINSYDREKSIKMRRRLKL